MLTSGIRDNRSRGRVGDFLREQIKPDARLSIVSAYFTIYAYHELQSALDQIEHLRFLFGEPRFIRAVDPERGEAKAFTIQEDGLRLATLLSQRRVARECAEWIRRKVAIRSVKQAGLLHGKLYHIQNGGTEEALLGSSNFTVRGLGLAQANNNLSSLIWSSIAAATAATSSSGSMRSGRTASWSPMCAMRCSSTSISSTPTSRRG